MQKPKMIVIKSQNQSEIEVLEEKIECYKRCIAGRREDALNRVEICVQRNKKDNESIEKLLLRIQNLKNKTND
jgi:hypothetical protein